MKKMISAVAMMAVLGMLVGCGNANGDSFANTPIKQTVSPVVEAAPAAATGFVAPPSENTSEIPPGIVIAVGEEVTIPIVVNSEDFFSGFEVALGYDAEKVEIISIKNAIGEIAFDQWVLGNPMFIQKWERQSVDILIYDVADKNKANGLSTGMANGMSEKKMFQGKVALFAVTIRGKVPGEIKIFPEFYSDGLLKSTMDHNGTIIEEHAVTGTFEEIPRIIVK